MPWLLSPAAGPAARQRPGASVAHACAHSAVACALADPPACPCFQPDLQRNSAPGPLDDWEVDPAEIQFHEKIASGAFGDLYKGTYCGQDVAIKIVRNVQNDTAQFQEFLQVWWGWMTGPGQALLTSGHCSCVISGHCSCVGPLWVNHTVQFQWCEWCEAGRACSM